MLVTPIPTREVCKFLRTGQLTSYVDYDDAWYANLGLGEVKEYLVLSVEAQYTGTTAITINGKTDNHSNQCVLDLKTGRIWSRYVSASVGPASNGKLPWTTTGSGATAEGIYPYCAAANVALLGGYGDWRIPYDLELANLRDMEQPNAALDATAFPGWPISDYLWSSTTHPYNVGSAMIVYFINGFVNSGYKTNYYFVALVRGG